MKKIFFALLTLFVLNLAFSVPVFAGNATLSLSPATGTFNRGCDFSVDINLDTGGAQTDGTDAILFYDPTRLTAKSITNGTIYSDYPGNSIDTQQGKITISGITSGTAFGSTGTLASIAFTVLDNAPTGTTIVKFEFDSQNKAKTTDSNVVERTTVADVLNQVTNGNFIIGSGTCTGNAVVTKTPVGGPDGTLTTTTAPIVYPTKSILPISGDSQTTTIMAIVGSTLAILGILGLALL